jgi:DNA-binding IclR family transcriptional regulator
VNGSARVLTVVEAIASADAAPVRSELAAATGLAPSTLADIVSDLNELGYVRIVNHRVFAGPALARLTTKMSGLSSLRSQLRAALRDLAEHSGETAQLSVIGHTADGTLPAMFAIDGVESRQSVRCVFRPGDRPRFWPSAPGKVFLALLRIPASRLPKEAVEQPFEPGAVDAELADIRANGYAVSKYMRGMSAIAAPLLNADGRVIAAIAIAGPDERMPDPAAQFWPLLKSTVEQIRLT